MPRPTSREKDYASRILIKMRADHGLTQAQLAAKLGCAVQTIGRWESFGPPRGPTLERLAAFADQQGYSFASFEFRALLSEEDRKALLAERPRPISVAVQTLEEYNYVGAFLEVLRNPELILLKAKIMTLLTPVGISPIYKALVDDLRKINAKYDKTPKSRKQE
jgi:transcriptional regulator with XRE-family HTH domain